jgi:HK97 family phage major capsid protein
MTAKELREKRSLLLPRMKDLRDRAHTDQWTAEDEKNWEAVNAEYNELTRQIEEAEKREAIDARLAEAEADQRQRVGDREIGRGDLDGRTDGDAGGDRRQRVRATEAHRALALQAWCRHQMGRRLRPEHVEACRAADVNPAQRHFDIRLARRQPTLAELRANEPMATTAGTGGETIPEGFVRQFELALLSFDGTRQVADVMRTDSGNPLPWPTSNDTGNTGEMIGESADVAIQNVATSSVTFNAYKFGSKLIKVPVELLQDSAFDLASWLAGVMGERIGRVQNTYFTTGSGTAQPKGIVTAATLGKTCASATAITGDEILDLIHSIDPAYRTAGCGFLMHDNIVLVVRKLKGEDSQYLWQPGLQAGQPERLAGYPLALNQAMASSVAAEAKTILFGQLKKYKIRDAGTLRIRRLVERYAEADQEGFVAFLRSDGDLLDAGTHPVKYMQQAAAES